MLGGWMERFVWRTEVWVSVGSVWIDIVFDEIYGITVTMCSCR